MKLRQIFPPVLVTLALLPCFGSSAPLRIEPAQTRVGLARVKLEISDLRLAGDRLQGTYEVRVPMAPSLNDRGRIEIDLRESLPEVISRLGTVFGVGHSVLDGRDHAVTCRFGPQQQVEIEIDTGDRILAFRTRYR